MGVCLGVWLVARLVFKFFKSRINLAQLTDIPATINHCEVFIFSCSVRIYHSCICVYHNSIRETVDYVCTCMCVCMRRVSILSGKVHVDDWGKLYVGNK